MYLSYLVASAKAVPVIPAARHSRRDRDAKVYLRLRKDHPAQGKHNPLQRLRLLVHHPARRGSVVTGFAIYKPRSVVVTRCSEVFSGRYWHFGPCGLHRFLIVHVLLVFVVDPRHCVP